MHLRPLIEFIMVSYLVYYCPKYIPKIVVCLYFDSYIRQKECVSCWDNIKTSYFSMSNGVKHGGVISSFF